MSMSVQRMRKLMCNWLLLIFWVAGSGIAVAAQQSLLMPRADQSLLLDAARAGDRVIVIGDRGHVLYSDDAARSWRQASVPTRAMLTAVHFPSEQRGWAVGYDGLILATSDGGENWVIQRDGLAEQERLNHEALRNAQSRLVRCRQQAVEAVSAAAPADGCAELDDLNLDIEDAQALVDGSVHTPPLLDVFFIDELRGVAVGAFNTLLRTQDGGITWVLQTQTLDNPDELHLNAITGASDGRLWIAAEGGLLFASEDAGATWRALDSPYYGSWFDILRAPGSDVLLAIGLRGNAFRSDDGGQTWLKVAVGTERTLFGGQFLSASYALLVGGVGTLLVSDDGGLTFKAVTSGTRQHLSAVTGIENCAVLVGQDGVHCATPFGGEP